MQNKPASTKTSITVSELKSKIDAGTPPFILDVREEHEYSICNLGGVRIGIDQIEDSLTQIPKDKDVVVHCHHGGRSQRVIDFLIECHGYKNLMNLAGGIHAWALQIDPKMAKY